MSAEENRNTIVQLSVPYTPTLSVTMDSVLTGTQTEF